MTRREMLEPGTRAAVSRDPRFRQALQSRPVRGDWRAQGLCQGVDPELFFPHPAEDPSRALATCRRCPVAGPCLATALDLGDAEGVWGATTGGERRPMYAAWRDSASR